MKQVTFTINQVQQIINTIASNIVAANCFDTLLMIKSEVDKQAAAPKQDVERS